MIGISFPVNLVIFIKSTENIEPVKKVETAIAGGDQKVAAEALKAAQPEIARGVARGVMHKNTAARKMSRLSKRVAAL